MNARAFTRRSLIGGALAVLPARAAAAAPPPRVLLASAAGDIVIELAAREAPVTVANFLRYVDLRLFDRGSFYRVVRPEIDHNPAHIRIIQGGLDPAFADLPPIAHESTAVTGLANRDGVLSMARDAPGSATSEFSISIGDNPALDSGGARQPDGQGFAAFGHVIAGMEVVRRINAMRSDRATGDPYLAGQLLDPPVPFRSVRRLPA